MDWQVVKSVLLSTRTRGASAAVMLVATSTISTMKYIDKKDEAAKALVAMTEARVQKLADERYMESTETLRDIRSSVVKIQDQIWTLSREIKYSERKEPHREQQAQSQSRDFPESGITLTN